MDSNSIFVEKTPRNLYNLIEIYEIFPKAKFVIIRRDYKANLQSIFRGWMMKESKLIEFLNGSKYRFTKANKGHLVKFKEFNSPRIPAFGLPNGWENHLKSLNSLIEYQLSESNRLLDGHLEKYYERTIEISFEKLIEQPELCINRINKFCNTRIPIKNNLKKINK